jgi:hypothetical protein
LVLCLRDMMSVSVRDIMIVIASISVVFI